MKNGIKGAPVPQGFPYKSIIDSQSVRYDVSPLVVGAIKYNETGMGQGPATDTVISGDGGHGIMQLTSSYPYNWQDPTTNIGYAIAHFIVTAWDYWATHGLYGDDLVRAIAATYNAGLGNAIAGHEAGDLDKYTTNRYGERALQTYHTLASGQLPA